MDEFSEKCNGGLIFKVVLSQYHYYTINCSIHTRSDQNAVLFMTLDVFSLFN